MRSLPRGWATATIGEVCTECEQRVPSADEIFRYIDIGSVDRVRKTILSPDSISGASAPSRARKAVRAGDVLVSMTRPNLNAVAMVPPELDGHVASTGFEVLRGVGVDPRWLYFVVRSRRFVESMTELVQGALYPAVRPRDVRGFQLPIAPLPEQRRISDKLDAMFVRLDACRDRLDRVPTILKRFRQAILSSAMSGSLTEEWRVAHAEGSTGVKLAERLASQHLAAGGHRVGNAADPTEGVHDLSAESLPAGWGLTTLRDAVDPLRPITYGILKPGPELSEGIPYVRVADFPNDRLALGGIRRTSPAIDAEFKRSRLRAGDLLLSIRGTVGRLIEIPQELEGANITQDTARLTVQPTLNRSFVLWYLRSEHAQSRMRRAVKGVAVRGINIGDVRALQLPVPSRAEQDEIVRCIESLFGLADSLEARFQTAKSCVELLTPALLEKAFRGELVPQDPKDEPASKLLERIALETPARVPGRRRMPPSRRTDLKPDIEGNLLDIISRLPKAGFTFDELRQASSADYESLKEGLFALLADSDSGVEQFFDTDAKTMKLRRVRK